MLMLHLKLYHFILIFHCISLTICSACMATQAGGKACVDLRPFISIREIGFSCFLGFFPCIWVDTKCQYKNFSVIFT